MKPQKKEIHIKEFRKATTRINELYVLIREAPYVPVKNKVFVGHWRFFKVRDDILRSSIGEQVKLVVDATNTWVLGRKKDPKSYEKGYSTIYCRYFGSTTVSHQHLRPINQREMETISFPNKETFLRKWFDVEEKTRSFGSRNQVYKTYYPKIPNHMLEFKFKAAYITEEQTKISDYESELAKLYMFMETHNGWNKLGSRHWDDWDRNEEKKKEQKKLMKQELEEFDYDF